MTENQHAHLDPQNAEHRLSFTTPEEHAEYQNWLDNVAYAEHKPITHEPAFWLGIIGLAGLLVSIIGMIFSS